MRPDTLSALQCEGSAAPAEVHYAFESQSRMSHSLTPPHPFAKKKKISSESKSEEREKKPTVELCCAEKQEGWMHTDAGRDVGSSTQLTD